MKTESTGYAATKYAAAKYAFLRSLPVMAGYLVLGAGFGMLLSTKGYGVWWALGMSIFIYAGSMQYVAIDLLAGGASLVSAALLTLLVNARHLCYGISMLERYRETGAKKSYLIFALTDETYSLVCAGKTPEGVREKDYYFWLSLFNQSYWVCGSAAGALLGGVLPFRTEGIEFSMTALFLVVFIEQWKNGGSRAGALIGIGCSALCLSAFGPERFLIPAMTGIVVLLLVFRRRLAKREKQEAEAHE